MTSNEKKVLEKFKEIKQGNTVTIAGTLRVTINYSYDVCRKLSEKGYLERLSPGRFALYRITPLGEEQVNPVRNNLAEQDVAPLAGISNGVKGEGETERELGVGVGAEEEDKEAIEGKDEYECMSCGAVVKEEDTECPKCGAIFEGYEEGPEEEMAERESSLQSGLPSPEERSEKPPQPTPQSSERSEGSDNVGEKTEILDHPSVPEDWKTCGWKWK